MPLLTEAQIARRGWRVFHTKKPKKQSPFIFCWLCDRKTASAKTGFCYLCDRDFKAGR